MKEPGCPSSSHPPSAVHLLRGGWRAGFRYCKPSEQRGAGEDDDDEDDNANIRGIGRCATGTCDDSTNERTVDDEEDDSVLEERVAGSKRRTRRQEMEESGVR